MTLSTCPISIVLKLLFLIFFFFAPNDQIVLTGYDALLDKLKLLSMRMVVHR